MFCYKTCGLAFVFLFAMLYLTFSVDKNQLNDNLMATLDSKKQAIYKKIVNERRGLYIKGYLIGFIIALGVLLQAGDRLNKNGKICMVIAISYIVMYFYYTLSPKSDYMVLHLDKEEQRRKWLDVNKTMQYNYHMGLLLGMVFIGTFMYGVL